MGVRLMRLPVQPKNKHGSLTDGALESKPVQHHSSEDKPASKGATQGIGAVHEVVRTTAASAHANVKPSVSSQTTCPQTEVVEAQANIDAAQRQEKVRGIPESLSCRLDELNMSRKSNKGCASSEDLPHADPCHVLRVKGECLDPRVQVSLEPRAQNTQRESKVYMQSLSPPRLSLSCWQSHQGHEYFDSADLFDP